MADVTVKVAAKNEVKTGLQSALNDVKKFGADAAKSAMPSVNGGGIRGALKGIGGDLASASTPAEALQAVAMRIAGAFGKITSAVAGFAIGNIIAGQFQKISEGISATSRALSDFQGNLLSLENATSLDGAVSGFDRLNAIAGQVSEKVKELKSDLGASIGNGIVKFFSGGDAFAEMDKAAATMRTRAAVGLNKSLLEQINNVREVAGAGSKDAAERLLLAKNREGTLQTLRSKIGAEANPETRAMLEQALGRVSQLFQGEDSLTSARAGWADQERLAKERERIDKQRREYDNQIALSAAKLSGDKAAEADILDRMDFQKALEGGATFEQAANIAAQNTAMRAQDGQKIGDAGSVGASAYQRLGFASNEYFDTRGNVNKDTGKLVELTKEMRDALKAPGMLLLKTQ